MKKIKLLFLLSFSCSYLFSQTNYDVVWSDGERGTITMNYDDPDRLPKYMFGLSPFGIMGTGIDGAGTVFQLSGEFRPTDRFLVDLRFINQYSNKLDGTVAITFPQARRDVTLMARYSLVAGRKMKRRNVQIKIQGDGSRVATRYVAKMPRYKAKNLTIDAGLNYFGKGGFEQMYYPELERRDTTFYTGNGSHFSVNIGFSYYVHQHYEFVYKGKTKNRMSTSRLYAYYSQGISSKYTHARWINGVSLVEIDQAPYDIKVANAGWRVGWDVKWNLINSNVIFNGGIEFGARPGFRVSGAEGFNNKEESRAIILAHFGIWFGKLR